MNDQPLRFLADESCDFAFVRALRKVGYDVMAIAEFMPGASDLKVLESAFGYLAIKKMGYSGREVGSFLNMRSYSAIRRPARFALNATSCLRYNLTRMIIC